MLNSGSRCHTPPLMCQHNSGPTMQVLTTLPEQLFVRVLAGCSAPIGTQLRLFEPRFYDSVLQAAYPSIDAAGVLHLDERRFKLAPFAGRLMPALKPHLAKLTTFRFTSICNIYTDAKFKAAYYLTPKALGNMLGGLTRIKRLVLRGNEGFFHAPDEPLTRRADAAVAGAIRPLVSIVDLDMSENMFGPIGAEIWASDIRHLTRLERLHLSRCNIGDTGAVVLGPRLAKLGRLKELRLCSNDLSWLGLTAILTQLAEVNQMETLDLSCNAIDWCDREGGTASVGRHLGRLTRLQHLDCHECGMYIGSIAAMVAHLLPLRALRWLDLGCNINALEEQPKAIDELRGVLMKLPSLQHLDLNGNYIGDEGMQVFAPCVAHLTNLRHLLLSANAIGQEGALSLGPHLAGLRDLECVDLQQNGLPNSVIKALVEARTKSSAVCLIPDFQV